MQALTIEGTVNKKPDRGKPFDAARLAGYSLVI
jgi:hypothetical protein